MIILRLMRSVLSFLPFMNMGRRCKSRVALMKINAARAYVLAVKKTRAFILAAVLAVVSFVFLINGLSLIQTAFFTYSMWSTEVKFVVALVLGGVEFLGAAGLLIYLFREETWGRLFEVHTVVKSAVDKESKNENA